MRPSTSSIAKVAFASLRAGRGRDELQKIHQCREIFGRAECGSLRNEKRSQTRFLTFQGTQWSINPFPGLSTPLPIGSINLVVKVAGTRSAGIGTLRVRGGGLEMGCLAAHCAEYPDGNQRTQMWSRPIRSLECTRYAP